MIGFSRTAATGPRKVLLETFWDFHCPYSKKMFNALVPFLRSSPEIDAHVQHNVVIHVQPWHSQATQMTMVALAAQLVEKDSEKLFALMQNIYDHQNEFSDQDCYDMTISQLYEKLFAIVKETGIDEAAVRAQLAPGGPRDQVVTRLKQSVKYARQNSIHVSPTVMVNGIIDNSISSSFTTEQWTEYLKKQIKASN
jgi:phenylpropionate dioxygenase-like ring-hydroxylating dioxygenase large terminal subunit